MRNVCILCGGNEHRPILRAKDLNHKTTDKSFVLAQCVGCGLISLQPRPSVDEIASFYPQGYVGTGRLSGLASFLENVVVNSLHRLRARAVMKRSGQNLGRVLDAGCGDGRFLAMMQRLGWDTWGVDISAEAVEAARSRGLSNIFQGSLEEVTLPENYFNAVTLWHVLEHLPDPVETLARIRQLLKEDGILVAAVPNIGSLHFRAFRQYWRNLDIPRHLNHFSPRTLECALTRSGYEVLGLKGSLELPLDLFHSTVHLLTDRFGLRRELAKVISMPTVPVALLLTVGFLAVPQYSCATIVTAKPRVWNVHQGLRCLAAH